MFREDQNKELLDNKGSIGNSRKNSFKGIDTFFHYKGVF